MRTIGKGAEPCELKEYRCKPDAVYDGPHFTSVKRVIREQLLREQGYLCAYCLKRIDDQKMKVEHWHCQDTYPNEQLDYRNMLGVCPGNEGQRQASQTCDTCKGNKDLKYNPAANDYPERKIRYPGTGKIQADGDDHEFDRQLNEVLNLNEPRLVQNRLAVLRAVLDTLSKRSGTRTPTEIQKLLEHWNTPDEAGYLREYCAVALYYLGKRLG